MCPESEILSDLKWDLKHWLCCERLQQLLAVFLFVVKIALVVQTGISLVAESNVSIVPANLVEILI